MYVRLQYGEAKLEAEKKINRYCTIRASTLEIRKSSAADDLP